MSVLGAVAASMGCATAVDEAPASESSLREQLHTALALTFAADPRSMSAHTLLSTSEGEREEEMVFGVHDGEATVRVDALGQVVLEEGTLDLTDLVIEPGSLPPAGLRITHVRTVVLEPVMAPGRWSADDEHVEAVVSASLGVDWAVVLDEEAEPTPLAPHRIDDVVLVFEATRRLDGAIDVDVSGTRTGEFFSWSDIVTMSDLSLTLSDSIEP